MLAVINLNQLAASPQAAPVHLFNASLEADLRLSDYTSSHQSDKLLHVTIAINSAAMIDDACNDIQVDVTSAMEKVGLMKNRQMRCVPRVHDDGNLVLEIWHTSK